MQTHFNTSAKRRYSFSCSEKFISSSCKVSSTEAAILCHVDRKTTSVKYNTMSNAYFQHGRILKMTNPKILANQYDYILQKKEISEEYVESAGRSP